MFVLRRVDREVAARSSDCPEYERHLANLHREVFPSTREILEVRRVLLHIFSSLTK